MKKQKFYITATLIILTIFIIILVGHHYLEVKYDLLLLRYGNPDQKTSALKKLRKTESGIKQGFNLAIEVLKNENPKVRLEAIRFFENSVPIMGKFPLREISKDVIPLLDDENKNIAGWGIVLMGKIGGQRCLDAIIKAMKNQNADIRFWAIYSFGFYMLDENTRQEYLPQLKKVYVSEIDSIAKWMAAVTLARMGDKSGYDLLKKWAEIDAKTQDFLWRKIVSSSALIMLGEKWPVPTILSRLNNTEAYPTYQAMVIDTLQKVTGVSLGFDRESWYLLPGDRRVEIIGKWIDWWKKNKDKLIWNQDKQMFEERAGNQIFPLDK